MGIPARSLESNAPREYASRPVAWTIDECSGRSLVFQHDEAHLSQ